MAYRPPVVRPSKSKQARAAIEASYRRQALVKALAGRLQMLVSQMNENPGFPVLPPGRPFPEHPSIPPREDLPPGPALPPRSPGPSSPAIPPGFKPTYAAPDYLPSWPPPSAADWRRMPGFYDEPGIGDNPRFF